MKHKILITQSIPESVKVLLENACECQYWLENRPMSSQELSEQLRGVEGVLLSGIHVGDDTLQHADCLKVISTVSVGYNNLDIDALKRKGIIATHTPEVLDETVADLVFALVLGTARRVGELDAYVKRGEWKSGDGRKLFGLDVHHKRMGIIGMGRIGKAVARRAKLGFGMEVVYHNRRQDVLAEAELGITYLSMETLLRTSDFVVLMVPLTPSTIGLMNREAFELMKPSGIFINASRGQTVDEDAMLEAVRSGRIWGAGLDVFCEEPLSESNPLLREPRILTLPHIGSATDETREEMAMAAAENLLMALKGQIPPYLVPEFKHDETVI